MTLSVASLTRQVEPSIGQTILVIDDETNLLIGLKTILKRAGYNVLVSSDGKVGIEIAQTHQPDLIVCDVMMPMVDGFEVQTLLKQEEATARIPFLFLSARLSTRDKVKALQNGAEDYITKPFDSRELLARIEAVFRRHQKIQDETRREMDIQINRIREEIVQNISHELRTPMTQIMMALEMILREKFEDPEELKWFVETALSQSNRLNGIIEDMIYLSNYDMGHVNTLRQPVEVEGLFLQPLRSRQAYYSEKQQKLDLFVAPDVIIHAPQREFKQAALHLLDNAFKFAPPMTNINVDLAANGQGGCILTVTNYGVSIPGELLERVFERNYQVSQGDTRMYNGLGVGLTIARLFARSLGGEVEILPKANGCCVRMTIPPGPLNIP